MTTAQRLQTVKANVPEVFHSGQLDVIKSSDSLSGSKSGESVVLSDISEVSHTLDVTVSGDTVTDFTGITLTRCGKNLFDINSAELSNCTLTDDNGILFGSTGGAIDIIVPPGQYTLSFERNGTGSIYVRNGKVNSGYIKILDTSDTSATFNFTGTVDGYLRIHTFASNLKLKNIQLELSSTASSYQAYQGGTYTPSADGTVSGVTNIYPVTTLFTDTDGAVINVNYYKDIDKTVDNLKTLIALSGGE